MLVLICDDLSSKFDMCDTILIDNIQHIEGKYELS